jgi:hypothetical protein
MFVVSLNKKDQFTAPTQRRPSSSSVTAVREIRIIQIFDSFCFSCTNLFFLHELDVPDLGQEEAMMRRAVVCFANVQEGRDPKILKELAAAASSVPLP